MAKKTPKPLTKEQSKILDSILMGIDAVQNLDDCLDDETTQLRSNMRKASAAGIKLPIKLRMAVKYSTTLFSATSDIEELVQKLVDGEQ